ncbi:MAG TPA: hypothetical protein VM345_19635 [Acidimicrobiales bacterium]|jgi:hypothetical protein|nr:hypothetical protein [Acidimicrobiales bacterium]
MWLIPAAVVVLAVLPLLLLARRVAAEILELRREVQRFSELRPALIELRSDAELLRSGVARRAQRLQRS